MLLLSRASSFGYLQPTIIVREAKCSFSQRYNTRGLLSLFEENSVTCLYWTSLGKCGVYECLFISLFIFTRSVIAPIFSIIYQLTAFIGFHVDN